MKLLLAAEIKDWHSLEPTRGTQHHRNELVKALKIVADQIANCGSDTGGVNWPTVAMNFRIESTPIAKPENEAA
jgi:hypothetical protein